MSTGSKRRLGRDDWARAALGAISEGGLAAVAVEPLAAHLGTTKGSFYWHFANREALVVAALELWESEHTEAVITLMDGEPDPWRRLRTLFTQAVEAGARDRVELALLAAADDPLVGPALQRVTARRIGYVAAIFTELGLPAGEARNRALLAFTVYLGTTQLAHVAPAELPPATAERQEYLRQSIALLTAALPTPPPRS